MSYFDLDDLKMFEHDDIEQDDIPWVEAVRRIEKVLNLHINDYIKKNDNTREAFEHTDYIRECWCRILKG
jgi:hypothetical protein